MTRLCNKMLEIPSSKNRKEERKSDAKKTNTYEKHLHFITERMVANQTCRQVACFLFHPVQLFQNLTTK